MRTGQVQSRQYLPPNPKPFSLPTSRPPDARSWPLGLVLFYLGRYDEAIARLETDIQYFEDRFDESATDERIWQAAAKIQAARAAGKDTARVAKGLPPLVKTEPNALRRTTYEVRRLSCPSSPIFKSSNKLYTGVHLNHFSLTCPKKFLNVYVHCTSRCSWERAVYFNRSKELPE